MKRVGGADAAAWAALADSFRELEQYWDAAHAYRRALSVASHDPVLWHRLGCTLLLLAEDQEAERAFRRTLAFDPRHSAARLNLGTLLRERSPREARIHLAVLRRHDPDTAALLEGNLIDRG